MRNVSSAGVNVLPATREIIPFSTHFVSVYHDVVPAGRISRPPPTMQPPPAQSLSPPLTICGWSCGQVARRGDQVPSDRPPARWHARCRALFRPTLPDCSSAESRGEIGCNVASDIPKARAPGNLTLTCNEDLGMEGTMPHKYHGLPAAASVEQAIVLAQLLILKDLERRALRLPDRPDPAEPEVRPAA